MQQPAPGNDFIEVARARDDIEAIMVSRMLSSMGIRVSGTGRSILVPRAQYARALERLSRTSLDVGAAQEPIGYTNDRGRVDEWSAELRRWRIPSFTTETLDGSGVPIYAFEVAVPDVARATDLLLRAGMLSASEREAPDARRAIDYTPPGLHAQSQVSLVSHAVLYVIGGLFLLGALFGLMGYLAR